MIDAARLHAGVRRLIIPPLLALGAASAALAGDPAYLAEMPTVEAVRSSVQGATPLDTLAYQAAVFDALREILQVRTERPGALADPSSLSAGERAVVESYQAASQEIYATPGVDRGELLSAGMRYSATPNFADQVAAQFFSPAWLAEYAASRTRFQTAYANQPDRDETDGSTSTSAEVPGSPHVDEPKVGILDRVIQGPDGEAVTVRQIVLGSTKALGALAIAALLAVRLVGRLKKGEDD